MSWETTGTVTVTNNSATVTGSGTLFTVKSRVGDAFIGPDGALYEIVNIVSNTVLSISPTYKGVTGSAKAYKIAPVRGYQKLSADRLYTIVNTIGDAIAVGTDLPDWLKAKQPTPVSAGGTGAETQLAARQNLGMKGAAVLDVGTAAGTVAAGDDARLTDAREWIADTIPQAEAEGGSATTRRAFTAQRVRQSIVAWFNGISGALGRTILTRTTAAQVRGDIGLGAVDNTSDTDKPISTAVTAALTNKVDKVAGKGLSDANYTQAEKNKLSSLESSKFVGLFVSESALPLSGSEGDYANVDGGVGSDVYHVIWDSSDGKWVKMQGVSTDLTPAQIKQQYESNPDTNAFTDTQKTKLTGIEVGATKNRADSLNADKSHPHTTAQVTGLDTTLAGKADKTTQVIAGTGLTGGGDLSANLTLSVNYGTTAGTSAQGNDSRITGALQTSQVAQVTGTSTTNVMSQKATTDSIYNIPSVPKSSAYTATASDKGKSIDTNAGVTIPASLFAVGDVIVVTNASASNISITPDPGVTFRLAGSESTGLRTLSGYGVATFRMVSNNVWFASGAGLS